MATKMEQKAVVVVLADISGYTRFMLDNRSAALHGQVCIDTLVEALVAQVDIPLVLQEIEGDAVFLYAADHGGDWGRVLLEVGSKLERFFTAFIAELGTMGEVTPCACAVCRNLSTLGLKLVVHVGEAVFHRVAGRERVSGPDVILAHRLLKNSLALREYLLLTAPAHAAMAPSLAGTFTTLQAQCAEFGTVTVHVRDLAPAFDEARGALYRLPEAEQRVAVDRFVTRGGPRIRSAALGPLRLRPGPAGLFDRVVVVLEGLLTAPLLALARHHLLRRLRARGRPRVPVDGHA